jgi:quercetin dioxygenase-like cupin family protein
MNDEPPAEPSAEPPIADVAPSGEVRPVDLRDYVDFSRDEARRVRVFATADLALDLWCIEPQQATGVLQYPDTDVVYTVIGGRSWFATEQGDIGLDPMGSLLVPAGTVHGIDNRGADPLIVSAAAGPPDRAAEDAPVESRGLAIRDDSQYGGALKRLGQAMGRALGR